MNSDEAGLWMAMDKAEEDIRTAGNRIDDPELTRYLHDIACRVSPEYCDDIRIYVLRVPYFNASMAPNGVLVIWSGLLLRATNEAQVAGVIGHEIGHYLRRHSLQRLRDTINTSGALVVVQLATAAFFGVGLVGDVAALAAVSGLRAYGRDQEREADGYGLALMARTGYDPGEAAALWRTVIEELEAGDDKKFSTLLFDSHPPDQERLAAVGELAERIKARGGDFDLGVERYRRYIGSHRHDFLQDELFQRDFSRTEVLLDKLIEDGFSVGELLYFKAELYRLRGGEGDAEKALLALQQAVALSESPPETHRALGLLYRAQGEPAKAREAFETYLKKKPEAADREMVRHMIKKEMQ